MVEIGLTAQQSLMRFLKELKTFILSIDDIIYDKKMHAYLQSRQELMLKYVELKSYESV